MNYAIIAAGEGSRLRKEGFKSVKPLVRLHNEYLIERLIRIFKDNDAEQISIIINEESEELKKFLDKRDWNVKINLIVKSTPSSLHSFWNIIHHSSFSECCLTTVDTIFSEKDFKKYISSFQNNKHVDALMATTKFIDDEKPLFIEINDDNKITAFLDERTSEKINSVSAGIYCLREKALQVVDTAINNNVSRMRNYQRMLVSEKLNVCSFSFGKVIDIDHVEDIKKAEQLLDLQKKSILALGRFSEYSPNSEDKDDKILNSVIENLRLQGYDVDRQNESEIDFSMKPYPYIISMARNTKVVDYLSEREKQGSIVVNSSTACKNCYRLIQTKKLAENNISIAKSTVVDTTNYNLKDIDWLQEGDFWIKRADFQTVEEIDVVRVKDFVTAEKVLENYKQRGIDKAVLSKHIEGDVIKFYGVSGSEWFYSYYPSEDKFHNKINFGNSRISFDKNRFIKEVQKAAKVLDLDIYGGDAIIDKNGCFFIIDMNDFPSFSSCREQAAKEITKRFLDKAGIN